MGASPSEVREFVLAALVEYECRLVRYTTRMFIGNEDRARDVVQHVFLKLCEQSPDDIRDRLGPWLFRVCRNRAIDELRRDSAVEQLESEALNTPDDRQDDPSQLVESADLMSYLQQVIAELPHGQQDVVELWSQGLRHDEISEVLGKSTGAVRGTLHRAIKSLKSDSRIRVWLEDQVFDSTPGHGSSSETVSSIQSS